MQKWSEDKLKAFGLDSDTYSQIGSKFSELFTQSGQLMKEAATILIQDKNVQDLPRRIVNNILKDEPEDSFLRKLSDNLQQQKLPQISSKPVHKMQQQKSSISSDTVAKDQGIQNPQIQPEMQSLEDHPAKIHLKNTKVAEMIHLLKNSQSKDPYNHPDIKVVDIIDLEEDEDTQGEMVEQFSSHHFEQAPKIELVDRQDINQFQYFDLEDSINSIPKWESIDDNLPTLKSRLSNFRDNGRIYDIIYMGSRPLKMLKQDHRLYIIDSQDIDQKIEIGKNKDEVMKQAITLDPMVKPNMIFYHNGTGDKSDPGYEELLYGVNSTQPSVLKLMIENPQLLPGILCIILVIFVMGYLIGQYQIQLQVDKERQYLMKQLNEEQSNNDTRKSRKKKNLQIQIDNEDDDSKSVQQIHYNALQKNSSYDIPLRKQRYMSMAMGQQSSRTNSCQFSDSEGGSQMQDDRSARSGVESYINNMNRNAFYQEDNPSSSQSNRINSQDLGDTPVRSSSTVGMKSMRLRQQQPSQNSLQHRIFEALSPQGDDKDSYGNPRNKQLKMTKAISQNLNINKRERFRSHDQMVIEPHQRLQSKLKKSPDSGDKIQGQSQQSSNTIDFLLNIGNIRQNRHQSQQDNRSHLQINSARSIPHSSNSNPSNNSRSRGTNQQNRNNSYAFEMVRVRGVGQEDDSESSQSPPDSKRSKLQKVVERVDDVDDNNSGAESQALVTPQKVNLFRKNTSGSMFDEQVTSSLDEQLGSEADMKNLNVMGRISCVTTGNEPSKNSFECASDENQKSIQLTKRSQSEFSTPRNKFNELIVPVDNNPFHPADFKKDDSYQMFDQLPLVTPRKVIGPKFIIKPEIEEQERLLTQHEPLIQSQEVMISEEIDISQQATLQEQSTEPSTINIPAPTMNNVSNQALVPYNQQRAMLNNQPNHLTDFSPTITSIPNSEQQAGMSTNIGQNSSDQIAKIQNVYSQNNNMIQNMPVQKSVVYLDQVSVDPINHPDLVKIPVDLYARIDDLYAFHEKTMENNKLTGTSPKGSMGVEYKKRDNCEHEKRIQVGAMMDSNFHVCDNCGGKIADIRGKCPMEQFLRCDICDIDICHTCNEIKLMTLGDHPPKEQCISITQSCCTPKIVSQESRMLLTQKHALTPQATKESGFQMEIQIENIESEKNTSNHSLNESPGAELIKTPQSRPTPLKQVINQFTPSVQSSESKSSNVNVILNTSTIEREQESFKSSPIKEISDYSTFQRSTIKSSMASDLSLFKVQSDISDESPLQQILDTGRFQKKFKDIVQIGEGGFGKVYRATYHVDRKKYAIKKVRLHILKSRNIDPIDQIYQHRVYRELQAASKITSEHIVRYFNSWFEELDDTEKMAELEYRQNYQRVLKKQRQRKTKKRNRNVVLYQGSVSSKRNKKITVSRITSQSSNSSSSKITQNRLLKNSSSFQFGSRHSQLNLRQSLIQCSREKFAIKEEMDDVSEEDQNNYFINQTDQKLAEKEQIAQIDNERSKQTLTSSGDCEKKQKYTKFRPSKIIKVSKTPQKKIADQSSESISQSLNSGSNSLIKSKRSSSQVQKSQRQLEISSSSCSSSESDSSSSSKSSESDSSDDSDSSSESDEIKKDVSKQKKIMQVKKQLNLEKKQPSAKEKKKEKQSSSSSYGPEYDVESEDDVSDFSQITLNDFLQRKQEYLSVNMMIQMEYCSGQSLQEYLVKRNSQLGYNFVTKDHSDQKVGVIDRETNHQVFHQMVNGLSEVHENNVLHRDLKPDNIFIDYKQGSQVSTKIGDFGLARMLDESVVSTTQNHPSSPSFRTKEAYCLLSPDTTNSVKGASKFSLISSIAGTETYMAPEVKKHFHAGTKPRKHNDIELFKKQDIYQLGLILYELSNKVKTNMQKSMLFKNLLNHRTFGDNCPLAKGKHIEIEMILHMTERNPEDRPNCQYIIQHYLPIWREQLEQERGNSSSSPRVIKIASEDNRSRRNSFHSASQPQDLINQSTVQCNPFEIPEENEEDQDLEVEKKGENTKRALVDPNLRVSQTDAHKKK